MSLTLLDKRQSFTFLVAIYLTWLPLTYSHSHGGMDSSTANRPHQNSQPPGRPPSLPPGALTHYKPRPRSGFVKSKGCHLWLNGHLFDFRSFNAPDFLSGTIYEAKDTARSIAGFASPTTRIYTLAVENESFGLSTAAADAHITGWDRSISNWIFNEDKWIQFDHALSIAAEEGIKIIFPIINQDYGDPSRDWHGNYVDLIRHRYNILDYSEAQISRDWFSDQSIRDDYKKIIKKLLTRKNTVNGRIYGHDDTFLAFETGNEMNWAYITDKVVRNHPMSNATGSGVSFNMTHTRPAPAEWTIDIARYIKSFAPNTLVMDGSYARNNDPEQAWPIESLRSPWVDLFSYHYYGDEDTEVALLKDHQARVESFGKSFIVGEHGFYLSPASFESFYNDFDGAGALVWSLRPHSETSGFTTHSEGNNIYSYHIPGGKIQNSMMFDHCEFEVVQATYQASFRTLNQPTPPLHPIPGPPYPFLATSADGTGLSFKGAAWADHYEIWGASPDGKTFVKVADHVYDNVEAGKLFIQLDLSHPTRKLTLPVSPNPNIAFTQAGWVDNKWSDSHTPTPPDDRKLVPDQRHLRTASTSLPSSRLKKRTTLGGWYCVRGITIDGRHGVFSQPVFIPSTENA